MLQYPRHKLRVRQNEPKHAESQVKVSKFHRLDLLQEPGNLSSEFNLIRYGSEMAILRFHITPNAKMNKVVGKYGDATKIKLRARAVEGKANAALRRFLAEELKIPPRAVVLERGQKSRDKVIRIDGLSEKDVRFRLLGTSGNKSAAIQ